MFLNDGSIDFLLNWFSTIVWQLESKKPGEKIDSYENKDKKITSKKKFICIWYVGTI